MGNYSIDSIAPGTTRILSEMGKIAIKIKENPQDEHLQKKYAFRAASLDTTSHLDNKPAMHLPLIYETIARSDERKKLNILNDLYIELYSIIQSLLKDARIPYYDLVNKLYSVSNFQVLHTEEDKSAWISIRDNYKTMLHYSIPSD